MTIDKTRLKFGAVTNGATLLSKTSSQIVRADTDWEWDGHLECHLEPAVATGDPSIRERIGNGSISVVAAAGLPTSGTVTGANQPRARWCVEWRRSDCCQPHAQPQRKLRKSVRQCGHAGEQPVTV